MLIKAVSIFNGRATAPAACHVVDSVSGSGGFNSQGVQLAIYVSIAIYFSQEAKQASEPPISSQSVTILGNADILNILASATRAEAIQKIEQYLLTLDSFSGAVLA